MCCNRGKDVSIENLHQGFTHIFESTFESTEGVAEYVAHPAHVEYANLFLANLEKVLVIDYKPTTVRVWVVLVGKWSVFHVVVIWILCPFSWTILGDFICMWNWWWWNPRVYVFGYNDMTIRVVWILSYL